MVRKYSHLISSMLAVSLALGILALGTAYARWLEQKDIHALAPLLLAQSTVGSALQQTAFQQPDLLVVYGSSEMLEGSTSYRAFRFFKTYPTGFNVYDLARVGDTSLDIAQDVAAIGPELRGKKVVISFTPGMFRASEVSPPYYAGNFSPLHAKALIFSPSLSLETKEIAAARMNEYPDTLKADPILLFSVRQLACGCRYGPYLYDLAAPLGQLDTWIARMQDHWSVLNYIWKHPEVNHRIDRRPAPIDWPTQIAQALAIVKRHSTNNPYGIPNDTWIRTYAAKLASPVKAGSADAEFRRKLRASKEWIDFGLVLRELKEFGAQPLIMSRPIDGPLWNAMGVSWTARHAYYDELQKKVAAYGFPFVDFASHDSDPYFSADRMSHASPEGWVYVDQTLDGFYHGTLR